MPPAPYYYAQNQIHNMKNFGPICKQHWPVDFNLFATTQRISNKTTTSSNNIKFSSTFNWTTNSTDNNNNLLMQIRLMKRLMSSESYAYLSPLIEELLAFEQSEDCLNLNIYAPLEGKYISFS